MIRAGLLVALGLAGCLHPAEVACSDGRVCPQGTQCDDLHHRCVTSDDLAACNGLADGAHCSVAGSEGICDGGVCVLGVCGDGIRNGTEDCDGADLGGADCKSLGYYDAPGLACTDYCKFDVTRCTGFCGDGIVNGNELCDGAAPPDQSCVDFGFDVGALGCRAHACGPDFSGCGFIGWVRTVAPSDVSMDGVWVYSPNEAYAVGGTATAGVLLRFDGAQWTRVATTSVLLSRVTGITPDDIYAVGNVGASGSIVHWDGSALSVFTPTPHPPLTGVFALTSSDVYAVGFGGTILHNNGVGWSAMTSGTTNNLHAVWGRNATDVWAVGDGPTALHYDGSSWTLVNTGAATTDGLFVSVTGTGLDDVYINQGVRMFHANWSGVATPWQSSQLSSTLGLWARDSVVLTTEYGGVNVLSPNGKGWLFAAIDPLVDLQWIAGDPGGHLMAVDQYSNALRYRGSMWATAGFSGDFVWGADATHVFTATSSFCLNWDGGVGGALDQRCSGGNLLHAIAGSSASNVLVVGNLGTIGHYDGNTWSATTAGSAALNGVWTSSATNSYAVGAGGVVFRSTGGTWTREPTPPTGEDLYAIWGSDPNRIFAVGANGRLLFWNGAMWTSTTIGPGGDLYAVWGIHEDVWVAGASGTLLRFHQGTWSQVPPNGFSALRSIWGTADNDIFAGGDGGTILHYDGREWSKLRPRHIGSVTSIWSDGRRVFFGGLVDEHGQLDILDRTSFPAACAAHETSCNDGVDDDCDFLVDCDDPDCAGDPACK